jgi:hypothetical protein
MSGCGRALRLWLGRTLLPLRCSIQADRQVPAEGQPCRTAGARFRRRTPEGLEAQKAFKKSPKQTRAEANTPTKATNIHA